MHHRIKMTMTTHSSDCKCILELSKLAFELLHLHEEAISTVKNSNVEYIEKLKQLKALAITLPPCLMVNCVIDYCNTELSEEYNNNNANTVEDECEFSLNNWYCAYWNYKKFETYYHSNDYVNAFACFKRAEEVEQVVKFNINNKRESSSASTSVNSERKAKVISLSISNNFSEKQSSKGNEIIDFICSKSATCLLLYARMVLTTESLFQNNCHAMLIHSLDVFEKLTLACRVQCKPMTFVNSYCLELKLLHMYKQYAIGSSRGEVVEKFSMEFQQQVKESCLLQKLPTTPTTNNSESSSSFLSAIRKLLLNERESAKEEFTIIICDDAKQQQQPRLRNDFVRFRQHQSEIVMKTFFRSFSSPEEAMALELNSMKQTISNNIGDLVWLGRNVYCALVGSNKPIDAKSFVLFITNLLTIDKTVPILWEILGRFYMGFDLSYSTPWCVPSNHANKSLVRDPVKAVKCIQKSVELDPLALGSLCVLVNSYIAGGQDAMAFELLKTAATKAEGAVKTNLRLCVWIYCRMGQIHLHRGELPQANACLVRALNLCGGGGGEHDFLVDVLIGLSQCNYKLGKIQGAYENNSRLLELIVNNPNELLVTTELVTRYNMGIIKAFTGDYEGGLEHFQAIIDHVETTAIALQQQQQQQQMLQAVYFALTTCLLNFGRRCMAQSSFGLGKRVLQKGVDLISLPPSNDYFSLTFFPQQFKLLGDFHNTLRNFPAGSTNYANQIMVTPWDVVARYDYVRNEIQASVGATASLLRLAQQCVLLNPMDGFSWNALGVIYAELGDVGKSQHCFCTSSELCGSLSFCWLNLSTFYLELLQKNGNGNTQRWTLETLHKNCLLQATSSEPDSGSAWLIRSKQQPDDSLAVASLQCAANAFQHEASVGNYQTLVRLCSLNRLESPFELFSLAGLAFQIARTYLREPMKEAHCLSFMANALVEIANVLTIYEDQALSKASLFYAQSVETFERLGMLREADLVLMNSLSAHRRRPPHHDSNGDSSLVKKMQAAADRSPPTNTWENVNFLVSFAHLLRAANKQEDAVSNLEVALSILVEEEEEGDVPVKSLKMNELRFTIMEWRGFDGDSKARHEVMFLETLLFHLNERNDSLKLNRAFLKQFFQYAQANETQAKRYAEQFVLDKVLKNIVDEAERESFVFGVYCVQFGGRNATMAFPWRADGWLKCFEVHGGEDDEFVWENGVACLSFLDATRDCYGIYYEYLLQTTMKRKNEINRNRGGWYWLNHTKEKLLHLFPWERRTEYVP